MQTASTGQLPPDPGERLVGWKAIATHLKVSPRTAVRWADTYGLPVQRVPRGNRPLVFAEPDELDSWWCSAAAAQARRESTVGVEEGSDSGAPTSTGVNVVPPADRVQVRAGETHPFPGNSFSRVLVALGILIAAVIAFWGVGVWTSSRSGQKGIVPQRLADGAHGEALSPQLVKLRLSLPGRPETAVEVAEGEMARIETAKTKLGLQARQMDNQLTVLAYRLDPIGSGESATHVTSLVLEPGLKALQVEVNGERFGVAWSGPLAASPRRMAGREPCCMVCSGVTVCGQVVSANCGGCQGNERSSPEK
jgi:hypothetical protein